MWLPEWSPPPSFHQIKGGNGLCSATSKLDHQRVWVFQSHLTLSKFIALIAISSFDGCSGENAHRRTWKSSNQTQIIFYMFKKKTNQPKNGKKKTTLSNSPVSQLYLLQRQIIWFRVFHLLESIIHLNTLIGPYYLQHFPCFHHEGESYVTGTF